MWIALIRVAGIDTWIQRHHRLVDTQCGCFLPVHDTVGYYDCIRYRRTWLCVCGYGGSTMMVLIPVYCSPTASNMGVYYCTLMSLIPIAALCVDLLSRPRHMRLGCSTCSYTCSHPPDQSYAYIATSMLHTLLVVHTPSVVHLSGSCGHV